MRYKNLLPAMAIFCAFLLTGLWAGQRIGRIMEAIHLRTQVSLKNQAGGLIAGTQNKHQSFAPQSQGSLTRQTHQEQELPRQKQRNILLIGINHLESPSPELESVWLILYLPDMPKLTLMPIYPTVGFGNARGQITVDPSLATLFQVGMDSTPDSAFFQYLSQDDIHWDSYVMVDEVALIDLIDFLGGLEEKSDPKLAESGKTSGIQALARLQPTVGNPQKALFSQIQLFQQFCRTASFLNAPPQRIPVLFQTISNHLVTDLEPGQVIADLESMLSSGGEINCEFPFLTSLSAAQ
jgi:hypothetical protein